MKLIEITQGTPEWHAHRAKHFNASDAAAMMGCSPHMTRTELLNRLTTGITAEVDPATQRRFDDGHRFENLARPLAESIIGDELYPVTGTNGKLSASFDGLTMDGETVFEHKTLNEGLSYTPWDEGNGAHLPAHYRVQMEHQLIVSGAKRVLFMASKWSGEELTEERHCWYVSDEALRQQIMAGWTQFQTDLASYVPTAAQPVPVGKAPETLPALHIVIQGGVSASNLAEFKETALGAIRSVNRELTTDVHFADAEKAVKWCADVEDRIKAAKDHALSQTASIDELFRTMDDIAAEARSVRLELDKLVKARKESIKGEIVREAQSALLEHIDTIENAMGAAYMPRTPVDFAGCIKGLKSVASIRNAVDTELARAKIAANEMATRIHTNLAYAADHIDKTQVPDIGTLVLKATDDFAAVIQQRVAAQVQREAEARERIRAEEAAKLAKAEADRQAAAQRADEERTRAAMIEADRIARQQAEKVSAQHIRDELQAAKAINEYTLATAPPCHQTLVSPEVVDTGARIKLGDINARLAPVSLTADGLAQLGFSHVATDKSAKLYRASDFPAMCAALVKHITDAGANHD